MNFKLFLVAASIGLMSLPAFADKQGLEKQAVEKQSPEQQVLVEKAAPPQQVVIEKQAPEQQVVDKQGPEQQVSEKQVSQEQPKVTGSSVLLTADFVTAISQLRANAHELKESLEHIVGANNEEYLATKFYHEARRLDECATGMNRHSFDPDCAIQARITLAQYSYVESAISNNTYVQTARVLTAITAVRANMVFLSAELRSGPMP